MFPTLTRDDVFRIETPRLWLRWPRLDDAAGTAPWVGLPEVAAMASSFKVGASARAVREKFAEVRADNASGRSLAFAITTKGADHVVIGMVGAQVQAGGRLELGYLLDPEHWGGGKMTEAVGALCDQIFDLTRVASIGASVRPKNRASVRVLEKCGFNVTGTGEREAPVHGSHPVINYGLARARPSPLLAALNRRAAGPKIEHELVGLV